MLEPCYECRGESSTTYSRFSYKALDHAGTSLVVGSFTVFAISAVAHVVLIGAVVITVGTFKVAEHKPQAFDFVKGYHTPSRGRSVYVDGKRIELPKGDAGGEHD